MSHDVHRALATLRRHGVPDVTTYRMRQALKLRPLARALLGKTPLTPEEMTAAFGFPVEDIVVDTHEWSSRWAVEIRTTLSLRFVVQINQEEMHRIVYAAAQIVIRARGNWARYIRRQPRQPEPLEPRSLRVGPNIIPWSEA